MKSSLIHYRFYFILCLHTTPVICQNILANTYQTTVSPQTQSLDNLEEATLIDSLNQLLTAASLKQAHNQLKDRIKAEAFESNKDFLQQHYHWIKEYQLQPALQITSLKKTTDSNWQIQATLDYSHHKIHIRQQILIHCQTQQLSSYSSKITALAIKLQHSDGHIHQQTREKLCTLKNPE